MPEILVEFVPDFSKLEGATEELARNGVISKEMAAMFKGAQKTVDQFGTHVSDASKKGAKDLGTLDKAVKQVTKDFQQGFGEGVEQALKESGVSLKQFTDAINKATGAEKSLKTELREITMELAKMKLEGKENTEQYQRMSQRAGELKDTLADVSAEIRRVGSDTRKLDTVIEFATGVTAAFAVAQGTIALFGEENEDLQKTLLKVNAAMSVLMGLQQIQNLLQKESNIMMAVGNFQKRLSVTVTNLETAATSRNIVVKTAATAAMRILNTVMKANPAFLLIGAFTALAGAIAFFTGNTNKSKEAVEEYNKALAGTAAALEGTRNMISDQAAIDIKNMELRGAKQSEITQKVIDDLKREKDAFFNAAEAEETRQFKIIEDSRLTRKKRKELLDESEKAEAEYYETVVRMNSRIKAEEVQLQIDLKKEREEGAEERKELNEKQLEEQRRAIRRGFEDFKAGVEAQLVRAEEGSFEELELRKKLLKAELQLALSNHELTENQRLLLIRRFFKEREELEKEFFKNREVKSLENASNLINAELAQLGLSFAERERLTIELLNKQRDIELAQVVNNKTKEKEINARFDKEIYEERARIRREALEKELADMMRTTFISRSSDESTVNDPNADITLRKDALESLQRFEIDLITRKRLANQRDLKDGVISLEEFTARSKDLANEEFETRKNFAEKYTDITEAEAEKRKAKFREEIDAIAGFANMAIEALRGFFEAMDSNENARIDAMKENLQLLRDNNVLTQKEFEQRMRQVERAEKEAMRRQAEREKTLALFEAFVNGATAIIKAADNPFQLAFTIALVAAQITAIASRPIPKFGKGVKHAPKGFAEVGETGTEIVKTDRGYYVAEHPQIIWMKGGERVYNPQETAAMIADIPQANMTVINGSSAGGKGEGMDVKGLAKSIGDEIAKHPRMVVNLDEDGFTTHVAQKSNKTTYLNKRYTFS